MMTVVFSSRIWDTRGRNHSVAKNNPRAVWLRNDNIAPFPSQRRKQGTAYFMSVASNEAATYVVTIRALEAESFKAIQKSPQRA